VVQTGVKQLGMNLGQQNFYDSGQMLRNLIGQGRNPGFEGEQWQSILHCVAATATSCTDSNSYALWPANFVKGATFQFFYGAASGETGTITSSTAANCCSTGVTINFTALPKAPAAGDFVILKMNIPGNAQAGWWSSTGGGATLSTELSDLSPNTPGKQALRMTAASSGQSAEVDEYFDGTAGRSFVQLKGTYQITFRAKGVGGSNQLSVTLIRQGSTNELFFNQTIQLTNQWQDYTYSFSANETGSAQGGVALKFNASGSSVLLDDVSVAPATQSGSNPTPFRDEVVDTLRTFHPGVLRYNDDDAMGSTIDNLIAAPFARIRSGYSEETSLIEDLPLGLHEFLQLCQTVGAEPYFNMPGGMSVADMQNLMQYLGGDSSTTYGAIRAARGQAAPWTSVFPLIHLELGNEEWNSSFAGMNIQDAEAYASRVTTIFGAAKSSPYYNAAGFDLVMGSLAVAPSYSDIEMQHASNYDSVSAAPYLLYTLNDTSSNEAIFGPMFAEPESIDSVSSGYMYQQMQTAAPRGKNVVVYEVNLTTNSGSASQSAINASIPSVGAGLTVANHMLLMIRDDGIKTQNVWALTGYDNQFNFSGGGSGTTPLFGTAIDMGGQSNLRRPTFLGPQLANTAILPTMLGTTLTGANPTWNQPLSTNGNIQLNNAHLLQSFAFSDGAKSRSVVVFNLSRTSALPVTFSGANAPTGTVNLGQLTSANITDNNESTGTVNITNSTLNNFQPTTPYSLPPFSMTVFSWQTP
jgi:hypothetical protein